EVKQEERLKMQLFAERSKREGCNCPGYVPGDKAAYLAVLKDIATARKKAEAEAANEIDKKSMKNTTGSHRPRLWNH
ncbi:hypothetical protein HDU98_003563, partial [Podochytrium sp. JEL0797]